MLLACLGGSPRTHVYEYMTGWLLFWLRYYSLDGAKKVAYLQKKDTSIDTNFETVTVLSDTFSLTLIESEMGNTLRGSQHFLFLWHSHPTDTQKKKNEMKYFIVAPFLLL